MSTILSAQGDDPDIVELPVRADFHLPNNPVVPNVDPNPAQEPQLDRVEQPGIGPIVAAARIDADRNVAPGKYREYMRVLGIMECDTGNE